VQIAAGATAVVPSVTCSALPPNGTHQDTFTAGIQVVSCNPAAGFVLLFSGSASCTFLNASGTTTTVGAMVGTITIHVP
jgi:hypothetical protein